QVCDGECDECDSGIPAFLTSPGLVTTDSTSVLPVVRMTARPAMTRTWLAGCGSVSWELTPVPPAYSAFAVLLRAPSRPIASQSNDGAGNQTLEEGSILHRRNPTWLSR